MTQEEKEKSITALRFNNNKPKWSLVHYASLVPMIRALEYGANKYTPDNWKKGGRPLKEPLECLQRHLAALMDGEEIDAESGCTHIGLLMCNAMFFAYFTQTEEGKKKNAEPIQYMGINGPGTERIEADRIREKKCKGGHLTGDEINYLKEYDLAEQVKKTAKNFERVDTTTSSIVKHG